MNKRPTYEQLISEKLENITIPDMADAIWARIESQLDIDMPTNDGSNPPTPENPSGGSLFTGGIVGIVLLAIVTIFLLTKNHKKENTAQPTLSLPSIETKTTQNNKPPDKIIEKQKEEQALPNPTINTNLDPVIQKRDSINAKEPILTMASDSINTNELPVTVLPPPSIQKADTLPKRKPRGVQGINADDYRIVPKRDSLP